MKTERSTSWHLCTAPRKPLVVCGGVGAHTKSELPQAGFPESGEVFAKAFEHGAHQRDTDHSGTRVVRRSRAETRERETERRAPTRDGALGGRGRYKPISSVYTCVHRIVWDMDHIVGVSHTPGTALPSRPRPAALSAENSLTDSRLAEVQYCLKLCEGEIYIEWQCVMRACLVT